MSDRAERPHPDDLRPSAFWHDFRAGICLAPGWFLALVALVAVTVLVRVLL